MSSFILKHILVLLIGLTEIGIRLYPAFAFTHGAARDFHDGREASSDFSNQWIVHLDGSAEAADLLAMKLGYKNLGEVCVIYL